MNKKMGMLCLGIVFALGAMLAAYAQETPPMIEVLLVDGTKTFTSTMKVAGTIGALRQMGLFEISVRLTDSTSDFDDPLYGEERKADEGPFDLILFLPRGLDTKSNVSIWLVSDGLNSLSPFVRGAIDLISTVVDQVFAGSGQTDESHDLVSREQPLSAQPGGPGPGQHPRLGKLLFGLVDGLGQRSLPGTKQPL